MTTLNVYISHAFRLKLTLHSVPSLHHPSRALRNRPLSPPIFRDFDLPAPPVLRPDDLIAPSSILGVLPNRVARDYQVPFPPEQSGFGRRVPARLDSLPGFPVQE
jgi:hypothetical protein